MSNANGRMSKNERREQAREQARLLREETRKRERRNRVFMQGGIIVGVLAIIAIIAIVIVVNVQPAGPGPANMQSGGILLEADGNGGIKVASTPGLADGADPVVSTSTAKIQIQTFIDLACPICDQFELGLRNSDGTPATAASLQQSGLTGDPSDYVGNAEYLQTLVSSGNATLEIFPVSILDRSYTGPQFATRAANALACIASNQPNTALDFIEAMYQNQPAEGSAGMTDDQIKQIAAGAGATDQSVTDCINAGTYKKWIASMTNRAVKFQFSAEANVNQSNGFGTPTGAPSDDATPTPSDATPTP